MVFSKKFHTHTFLFLLFAAIQLYSNSIEELRYQSSIFNSIDIVADVQYGRNCAVTGDTVELYLDCYQPTHDYLTKRPLVILLHGGGFHDGEKEDPKIIAICRYLTARGYVTASVGYRTGIPKMRKRYFGAAVLRGIEDTQTAIDFFKLHSGYFGIDTTKIFLGGISAGAVIALHYAFWDCEDVFPYVDSTDAMYSVLKRKSKESASTVKGIINCWGAVFDSSFIENNNTPVLSFHGTRDRLAPFNKGRPFYIPWLPKVYGSSVIHRVSLRAQHFSILKSYKGMRHGHDEKSVYMDTTLTIIQNFLTCLTMEQCDNMTILWRLNTTEEYLLIQPELWYSPLMQVPEIALQEDINELPVLKLPDMENPATF